MRLSLLALLVLVAALLAALPASASAARGPCLTYAPGPTCQVWTGQVTFVADGDTLDVDVARDGTSRPLRVRVTGLQAMEQTAYSSFASRRRGECHAVAATNRLDRLVRAARGRVRLAAHRASSRSGSRWRRSVAVRLGGRWRDVGSVLLREGHALWLPNGSEYAWNASYARFAADAAARGVGLWDTNACGAGPSAESPLGVSVNWDADGNDAWNANGEWIRVRNRDPLRIVPLAGWWVRDSALRRFRFPSWAFIPPGGSVDVHVGSGRHTWTSLFWGLSEPAFENISDDGRAMGDGAYLFDPDGDLRGWDLYH